MADQSDRLLVLATPEGGTLTWPAAGDEYVVDFDGERLGEIRGDFTPFLITIDDTRRLVVAGALGGGDMATRVSVGFPHDTQTVKVAKRPHGGVWMTFPEPFRDGMTVTAVGLDEHDSPLWEVPSPPLTADRLDAVFGRDWIGYAHR
jgi:hypothetical protein